jgi:hypothetical protein
MIKFKADNLLGFGLSKANIKKLKKGQPISINMAEMGFPGIKAMIFYGETEEQMQRDMAEFIGPETKYSSTMDN